MSSVIADKKLFLTAFAINFCISLGFCMADSFFSIYYKSLGAEALLIGFSAASYQLAKALLGPVLGKIADYKGYVRVIVSSVILYLFVAAAFLIVTNIYLLIGIRLIQGIACAALRPVLYGFINLKMNRACRSETFGTFDIAFYAALALGPLLGGVVSRYADIAGIFHLTFVLCIIALMLCIPLIKQEYGCPAPRTFYSRSLQFSKTEIAMYAFIFGKASSLACFTVYYPIYLIGNGLSSFETGIVLSCSAIGMCFFIKPMGRLADISSKPLMVFIGGCSVSLMYFWLPEHISFYNVSVFSFLCGAFGAMSQPAGVSLLMQNRYQGRDASMMGIFNSVMGLGFAFGAVFSSGIADRFGINEAFTASGIIGFISTLLFLAIIKTETAFPRFMKESIIHKN